MTILTRVTGKVFGSEAPADEIGVFGSAKDGHPTNSSDVATIQSYSNDAYLKGWGSGIVSAQNFPPMEEVTGVLKTISYQTCYALQSGVPIYDAGTEYGAGDIVKVPNGVQLDFYIAQRDATTHDHTPNINKWGDPLFWQKAIIVGDREIGVPQISLQMTGDLPDGYIDLNGGTVSKNGVYATLYSIYLDNYAIEGRPAPDGEFRLPDFTDCYLCGGTTAGYIAPKLPNPNLSTNTTGAHTHTRGTMNITGAIAVSGWGNTVKTDKSGSIFSRYSTAETGKPTIGGDGDVDNDYKFGIYFNASKNWTGETQSNGAHSHSIVVGNSIYTGSANEVKTKGIKLRVFTRYK